MHPLMLLDLTPDSVQVSREAALQHEILNARGTRLTAPRRPLMRFAPIARIRTQRGYST